jgi:membrane protein required for colicin V production
MGLDIIVVLIVAFGFYAGFSRGLVKTAFDTMSLLIGILAAMRLSGYTIDILEGMFNISPKFTVLIGLVVTFIVVMSAVRFIGRRIEDILEAANINIINKLAGGVVQGLFFAFLLSMMVWALGNYNVMKESTKENSITYPYLEPLPEAGKSVFIAAKPIFQDFWDNVVRAMKSVDGSTEPNVES